jgi:serine/threonine protein kinase
MAPEQIFGERDIDGKADVWALGVILYECLAGERPVEGGVGQILKAVTSHRIVPLAERVTAPELAETCRFVMSMLAMEPPDRPAMSDVESELERLRDDSHEVSAAIARSETKRGGRRNVGVIAAIVAVIVLGGLVVRFGVRDRSASPIAPTASVATSVTAPSATAEPSHEIAPPSASTSATVMAHPTSRPTSTQIVAASPSTSTSARASNAELDVVLGRVGGMGNQPTQSDVVAAMRAMKPCFPAPTTDEKWTVALEVTWPKGGGRAASFGARRNGITSANAPLEACAKKTFDAARITVPDGQDDVGGTSYVRMSVGYY